MTCVKCAFFSHSDHKVKVQDLNWETIAAYLDKVSKKLKVHRDEIDLLTKKLSEITGK